MPFYTKTHQHYCGIDLHAKTMYLCILDREGQIVFHKNLRSGPEAFLEAVAPFRDDLVVAVECIFTWYWLADLCRREGIEFVLGHALYMKAIHGGKAKNDKVDSQKIATLLRGGNLPQAYVYPPEMRATRDLLRRRLHLVRRRANLLAHIQNTHHQYNLPEPTAKITYKANREGVAEAFEDPDARKSLEIDFALISGLVRHGTRPARSGPGKRVDGDISKRSVPHEPRSGGEWVRIATSIPRAEPFYPNCRQLGKMAVPTEEPRRSSEAVDHGVPSTTIEPASNPHRIQPILKSALSPSDVQLDGHVSPPYRIDDHARACSFSVLVFLATADARSNCHRSLRPDHASL